MSRIRSENTKPELLLFTELRKCGYKFIRHSALPGKPDVQLKNTKIVIFIDGEFWHGKRFNDWKHKLSIFWLDKITANMLRDRRNDRLLRKSGWKVIHLWGKDIVKNKAKALLRISRAVIKTNLN